MPRPLNCSQLIESRGWLYQKCVVRKLSVPAIAKLVGCGYWKVHARMKKFGIPRHPRGFCLSQEGKNNYMMRDGVVNPFLGKTHSEKTRKILSRKASVPKPYLRGENNGMFGRTGNSNPNWKGGGTPERQSIYIRGRWKRTIKHVFKRDAYCCRRCGKAKSKRGDLHVHHILGWSEFPKFRFRLRNLVILCESCHDWVHSNANSNKEWIGANAKTAFETLLANC